MNRVNFFSGFEPKTEDFQYLQTALEEQIKNRTTDQYSKGVVSPVDAYVDVDIKTASGVPTMKFLPFAAYTNSGERVDIYQDIRQLALDLTDPSNRELGTQGILEDDQFGWEESTPYTICVKYVERGARPRPNKNTQLPYATRVYSGFKFYAMRTNIDPLEENGVNPYIILANAIYREGNLTITTKDVTEYAGIDASRVLVKSDNSLTTTYSLNNDISVKQHIKSIGDISYVSEKNPHGITPKILGIDANAVPEHERIFHSSGFIGDPLSTNSCLYTGVNSRNRSIDELVVYNFTEGELLHYQGLQLNTLQYGQNRIFIDLEDDDGPLPDGNYIVYVNVKDGSIGIASQNSLGTPRTFAIKYSAYGDVQFRPSVVLNSDLDTTSNYRLFLFKFSQEKETSEIPLGIPGLIESNFISRTDYRTFGSISADNLQRTSTGVFVSDFPFQLPEIIFNDGTSLSSGTAYPDYYMSPTLLPKYDTGTNLIVTTGKCKDSTNRFLLNLQRQLTKIINISWSEGDSRGGLAPKVTLTEGTWHIFLVGKPDGVCDVAFDSSITAANLIEPDFSKPSPLSGYRYYRRIGSIVISNVATTDNLIRRFVAIPDGGSGINWIYLDQTQIDMSANNNNPALGGVNVIVPSGIPLKVTLNAQNVPADFTTGSFIEGYSYTTQRAIGKGEFTGFTTTGRLPFNSGSLSTAVVYTDSFYDKRTVL